MLHAGTFAAEAGRLPGPSLKGVARCADFATLPPVHVKRASEGPTDAAKLKARAAIAIWGARHNVYEPADDTRSGMTYTLDADQCKWDLVVRRR